MPISLLFTPYLNLVEINSLKTQTAIYLRIKYERARVLAHNFYYFDECINPISNTNIKIL